MSFLLEKAQQLKNESKILFEQAYKDVPEKYHQFVISLSEDVFLGDKDSPLTSEEIQLGLRINTDHVFMEVARPYMSVNGRVKWARDDHFEAKKRLDIKAPMINGQVLTVEVESEMLGIAAGSSIIHSNGSYASASPIEVAQTAAIGRSMMFLGYGSIGTAVASPEEIAVANNKTVEELETKSEPDDGNESEKIRFLVLEDPIDLSDGHFKVKVQLSDRSETIVLFPPSLNHRKEKIRPLHTYEVNGWENARGIRIDPANTINIIKKTTA